MRNSDAIDLNSRTLNVEVDIDNRDGRIKPGAYVFVHLKLPDNSKISSRFADHSCKYSAVQV